MDWLYYLLESNLYLLIFYGFYRLFLHRETFYNSNRYYLLLSSLMAFILPVLQLGFLNPKPQINDVIAFPPPIVYTEAEFVKIAAARMEAPIDYTTYLYPLYLFICCCFTLNLVLALSKIIRLWFTAKKGRKGAIIIIELEKEKSAFSFFNLLFIHPQLAEKETVLKHEMVHIKQKHSLDILFFEVLQVACWFNPVLYFIKKDIKLLHEYIADELTTRTDIKKHDYAMFLIENSFGISPTPLTNQIFNQSILKRRINMLNKKRTAGWARLRLLLVLPLGGVMLCTSTMAFTKDYGYIDLLPEKSFSTTIQEVPKVENIKKQTAPKVVNQKRDQIKFPPPVVKKDQVKFPPSFKPKTQNRYIVWYKIDSKTGNRVRLDKRFVVVNGKPFEDQDKFYGALEVNSVTLLNAEEGVKRYGSNGKNGVVEITGDQIKYITEIVIPPAPKVEVVRFPPPAAIYKTEQKYFTPGLRRSKTTGTLTGVDKRYIVVNGKPVEDNSQFYGVTQSESVTYLNPSEAIKVYGVEKGRYGAVEIKGANVSFNKKDDQIKFPPPIVREDRKNPPAVEPPPANYKTKKDQIKFPPPVVREDRKNPPAVEPPPANYKTKKDQIKFPPPVVKEDKKGSQGIENKALNLKLKQTIVNEIDSAKRKALALQGKERKQN